MGARQSYTQGVNTTREWQRSLAVGARVSFESLVLEPAQPSAPAGAQPAQIRCQQAHSSTMLCLVSLLSISEFVFFSLASFDCIFIICRIGTRETRSGASGPRHPMILAIALRAKSARGSLARVQSLR